MERLTEKVLGSTQLKDCGNDFCKETCAEHDEEKSCNNCPIQKAFEKLAEYEDLEEQGKLPKLPCAVGDRLYQINADEPSDTDIQSYAIDNIVIREGEILFKYDSWDGVICDLDSLINGSKYLDCLRTFFTYEEAEAALKDQ